MIKVGLSGNRYSGKDRVASLFDQIKVPVMNLDILLKFMLSYNYEVLGKVNESLNYCFINGKLNIDKLINSNKFDDVLDIIEPEIFQFMDKFQEKHNDSLYCVFHSSILFERKWNEKMDANISVFAPAKERIERARFLTNQPITSLDFLHKNEMSDLYKNNLSNYVIHNYEHSSIDVMDSVCEIDRDIVDKYLKTLPKAEVILLPMPEIGYHKGKSLV